jgi:hypothetical protein
MDQSVAPCDHSLHNRIVVSEVLNVTSPPFLVECPTFTVHCPDHQRGGCYMCAPMGEPPSQNLLRPASPQCGPWRLPPSIATDLCTSSSPLRKAPPPTCRSSARSFDVDITLTYIGAPPPVRKDRRGDLPLHQPWRSHDTWC